ncbi:MAG TPA: cobalt-precorrin-6A synthase, partial [Lachnospiraceae bacterium]|nr:cobalt-precorrin-6A synthase [Lachnospiraceae bacterium]
MRNGFTTGSCAAAAAKAAAYMLFSGCEKNEIKIMTPAGIMYETKILDIKTGAGEVSCAVKKDSGDDPDITNGILIYAGVKYTDDGKNSVSIDGGMGVGRVTRDGLDQPKGNAAINSVPRKMIEKEVREVMDLFDVNGSISVTVFVPEGEEVANKTFNSRLGIEGGISIIGTSGIVEPMSIKAILDTIRLELNVRKEAGDKTVVIAPGNYGLDF